MPLHATERDRPRRPAPAPASTTDHAPLPSPRRTGEAATSAGSPAPATDHAVGSFGDAISAGVHAPSSTSAITADLHQVGGAAPEPVQEPLPEAPDGGAGGDVAPVEYISASGFGHSTTSILMDRIVQLMHADHSLHFVDAARRVARQQLIGDEPMQSARVGAPSEVIADPDVRYALVIAQVDYPGHESDLQDVAVRTTPGAAARRVIEDDYGEAGTQVERDLTGDQMVREIRTAIDRVAGGLQPAQRGELMVNFQGHGGASGIDGVDWEALSPAELADLSAYAVAHRVHLIIVSDGCFGGMMASEAQTLANRHLEARVDGAEGSGQITPAAAATLRTELEQLRHDLEVARAIGQNLETFCGCDDAPTGDDLAAAVAMIHDWLEPLGDLAMGLPLLSAELNARLHDAYQRFVVDQPAIPTAAALLHQRNLLDDLATAIGSEVTLAQERIAGTLELAAL